MDIWDLVVADMRSRQQKGKNEYGKPVSAYDCTENWLQHAYEEALDLAVYLKAEIEKRKEDKIKEMDVE